MSSLSAALPVSDKEEMGNTNGPNLAGASCKASTEHSLFGSDNGAPAVFHYIGSPGEDGHRPSLVNPSSELNLGEPQSPAPKSSCSPANLSPGAEPSGVNGGDGSPEVFAMNTPNATPAHGAPPHSAPIPETKLVEALNKPLIAKAKSK